MSENIDQKEVTIIKKMIMDHYHKAQETRDPKFFEGLLHNEWKFFSFNKNGELTIVDKEKYFTFFDPKNIDTSLIWNTEFLYVDITEKIGAIKIKVENQKFGYIDYFQIMKFNGKWQIMHKLSHQFNK